MNHERRAQAQADQKALEKIGRAVAGIMAAIEDGMYQLEIKAGKARMNELERQRAEIIGHMAQAPAALADVHPNVSNLYRAKVVKLAEALDEPETNRDAAEAIRALIGEVVLTPGEKRGEVHASLCGELTAILETAGKGGKQPNPVVRTNAAAGPHNHSTARHGSRIYAPAPRFMTDSGLDGRGKADRLRNSLIVAK